MNSFSGNENFWQKPAVQILILVLVVVAAAGITTYLLHASKQTVLFDGLTDEEAAQVTKALDDLKAEYSLENGGSAVTVNAADVDNIRLDLISEGLKVGGGIGFELFDNADFGMTEFAEKINFQRALEGEIARTIATMPEVKQARVHLVLPQRELFQNNSLPAKASVTLILEQNLELDAAQVEGVRNIVAASVNGLKKRNVLLTDQSGRILGETESSTLASGDLLKRKMQLEAGMTEKVESLLTRIFGHGNYVVSVDVALSSEKVRSSSQEVVLPDSKTPVMTHKRRVYKKHDGGSSDNSKAYDRTTEEESDEKFATGQINKEILEKPGKVLKVSVGVLVPEDATEAQVDAVDALAKSAVGYDAERGDSIVVGKAHFYAKASASARETNVAVAQNQPVAVTQFNTEPRNTWTAIAIVVAVVMLLLFYAWPFRTREVRLSHGERQRMLTQLKEWLAEERVTGAQGERP